MAVLSDVGLKSFAMKIRKCAVIVPILALLMTGCQPSTVISTLEAVVAAAEIALPVIGSAVGLPPQTMAGIVQYLQLVDVAITRSATILAGTGTVAEKSAQIAQAFAGIANGCGCIPAGTPQTVVAVVNAVIQAVSKFLTNVGATGTTKGIAASTGLPVKLKVSGTDRAELLKIRERAKQHMAKLQEVKR